MLAQGQLKVRPAGIIAAAPQELFELENFRILRVKSNVPKIMGIEILVFCVQAQVEVKAVANHEGDSYRHSVYPLLEINLPVFQMIA